MVKRETQRIIRQTDLIKEFFEARPRQNIETFAVADWATEEYKRKTGKILRDPGRAIRTLCEKGFLKKIKTGCYRYEPN